MMTFQKTRWIIGPTPEKTFKMFVMLLAFTCFFLSTQFFAHLISIPAVTPFPATPMTGSLVTATYNVKNITSNLTLTVINKSKLPAGSGLTVSISTCGSALRPGQSCTIVLQLNAPPTPQIISSALTLNVKNSMDCVRSPFTIKVTRFIAYVANDPYSSGSTDIVSIYPLINGGANLGSCVVHSDPTFNSPIDIILNKTATIAYVANSNAANPGSHTISICPVNSDGSLNACQAVDAVVYSCAVNSNGSLSHCGTPVSPTFPLGPNGRIALNSSNTLAFVTQSDFDSGSNNDGDGISIGAFS